MLQIPLHHCYLVPAVSVTECLEVLKAEIADVCKEDSLTFDVETTEFFDIAMARDMRALGLQQARGEVRCIIRAFDTIGGDAQNALLKILEDPAAGAHFFLVTPNADALFETVRSRVWRLPELCMAASENELSNMVEDLLASKDLPAAFSVMEEIDERPEIRTFIKLLAACPQLRQKKYQPLARAVEKAAGWSRGSGSSVKLLGQHLAIASQQSKNPN